MWSDCTILSAITLLKRVVCSILPRSGCSTLAAGAAGFAGAETGVGVTTGADTAAATGLATDGAATGVPDAFKTSSFLTRPFTPEPEIVEISIHLSLASCLTIGVA